MKISVNLSTTSHNKLTVLGSKLLIPPTYLYILIIAIMSQSYIIICFTFTKAIYIHTPTYKAAELAKIHKIKIQLQHFSSTLNDIRCNRQSIVGDLSACL